MEFLALLTSPIVVLGALLLGLVAALKYLEHEGWYTPTPRPAPDKTTADSCAGITLTGTLISYQGDTRPVAGVSATVEQTGEVSARSTATRTLLLKQKGWQKKMDNRELWITVDGPDFQWAVNVPVRASGTARRFVAAINTTARLQSVLSRPSTERLSHPRH